MAVLFGYHPACEGHEPGAGHPESPRRLEAIRRGIEAAQLDALIEFAPRNATRGKLARVHDPGYVASIERLCISGGGALDPDTAISPGSFAAALRAAGAGLDAIERLDAGEADAAFLAVRPPGHHACRDKAMGFCLFNNAAIATAELVARGDRVLILDFDAHHGNGTQELFYAHPDVLYVSLHQFPFYPGTGDVNEVGEDAGLGTTINVPLRAGTGGYAYRCALEELIAPAVEAFSPTWLVVSMGFDAHRSDPLTALALTAGDYADMMARSALFVAPGRRLVFLEGGYDPGALAACAGATVSALEGGGFRPEQASPAPKDAYATGVIQAAHLAHERAWELASNTRGSR